MQPRCSAPPPAAIPSSPKSISASVAVVWDASAGPRRGSNTLLSSRSLWTWVRSNSRQGTPRSSCRRSSSAGPPAASTMRSLFPVLRADWTFNVNSLLLTAGYYDAASLSCKLKVTSRYLGFRRPHLPAMSPGGASTGRFIGRMEFSESAPAGFPFHAKREGGGVSESSPLRALLRRHGECKGLKSNCCIVVGVRG